MTAVYGHIYVILTIYEIFEHNGHAAWMLVLFMIQYTIHQAHVHLVALMKCDPWQVYTVMAKTQTTSRKKVIIVAFNMDLNLRYRQFYFYYTMNTIITLNSRHGELTIVMHPLNALIFWCNTIEIRPICFYMRQFAMRIRSDQYLKKQWAGSWHIILPHDVILRMLTCFSQLLAALPPRRH